MCLACVGQLVEVDEAGGTGVVDADGRQVPVSLVVLEVGGEMPLVGEWVLVHTGFVVEVLEEEVAEAELEFGRRVRAAVAEVDAMTEVDDGRE